MNEINLPDVQAELAAVFRRYEDALLANDVAVLDELFWHGPDVVRYGVAENQYGFEAVAAWRATCPPQGVGRALLKTVITTYGRDFGTAHCEFRRAGTPGTGRQSQTWLRTPAGWRIVAAHVSFTG